MIRYAAAVLTDADSRILLGLRSADRAHYPGVWDFIGGHCDEGEEPEAAMIRELEEELGVRPKAYARLTRVEENGMEMIVFIIRSWSGEVENCAPEEHEALGWFSIAEARRLPLPHPAYASLFSLLEGALQK